MKTKKSIIILLICGLSLCLFLLINFTKSAEIEENQRVKEGSQLIYYIDFLYDGIDRNGIHSSESNTAMVDSDFILVEDELPPGLIFEGFVTNGGTIGAVRQDGTPSVCTGNVYVDSNFEYLKDEEGNIKYNSDNEPIYTSYRGLHYDETTRKVSFRIKNLQAGCKLTVGIKTKVPTPEEESYSIWFHNTAKAIDNKKTVNSNTVSVYIQKIATPKPQYTVSYSFDETAPKNLSLPLPETHIEGETVNQVNNIPNIEGYEFLGWSLKEDSLTISNGTFTMPNRNIEFVGSFRKITIPEYNVSYKIEGDQPNLKDYSFPINKTYLSNVSIKVSEDTNLKKGMKIGDYEFMGWKVENDSIDLTYDDSSDYEFVMPSHDVTLIGEFKKVYYQVEYKFIDNGNIPPESTSLLPPITTYKVGEKITLEKVRGYSGYYFSGWTTENTTIESNSFTMPENNVTIYGTWNKEQIFGLEISKEPLGIDEYYMPTDDAYYKVIIKNNNNFAVKDISIEELSSPSEFINSNDEKLIRLYNVEANNTYEVGILNPKYATIPIIEANNSVEVYTKYKVQPTDKKEFTTETKINLASTEEPHYEFDTSKEYIASATSYIKPILTLCKEVTGIKNREQNFQFHITGTNGYDTWTSLNNGECKMIYLDPNYQYSITELGNQEYELKNITLENKENTQTISNGEQFNITYPDEYKVTFTNNFVRKKFYHSFGRVINEVKGKLNSLGLVD